MTTEQPPIQLIANLVVEGEPGQVLLARYNPEPETDEPDANDRWWLPAHELEPYQHPADAAQTALDEIGGLTVESSTLSRIQSFRGRRGWHISFDYHVKTSGEPASSHVPAAWHQIDDLPATMHGNWERDTILAARSAPDSPTR